MHKREYRVYDLRSMATSVHFPYSTRVKLDRIFYRDISIVDVRMNPPRYGLPKQVVFEFEDRRTGALFNSSTYAIAIIRDLQTAASRAMLPLGTRVVKGFDGSYHLA